jgi:hypothetical protein
MTEAVQLNKKTTDALECAVNAAVQTALGGNIYELGSPNQDLLLQRSEADFVATLVREVGLPETVVLIPKLADSSSLERHEFLKILQSKTKEAGTGLVTALSTKIIASSIATSAELSKTLSKTIRKL